MATERQLEWAAKYYSQVLAAQTGKTSRDQKRRDANSKKASQPFDKGRDPIRAGESLENMLTEFRWTSQIERATLFSAWHEIVGTESAAASVPEELVAQQLVVRCRSTAWATQLRLLQNQILEKINERFPGLSITEIRFLGPEAPSWKKGRRSVPGRGPRDTYG